MKAINTNNYEFATLVINSSLIEADSKIQGGSFAHIEYNGIEKLPKKLGILGVVTKHTEGIVQMKYSYENAVNNRLEKQGDERNFKAQGLPFGQWFIPNFLIAHKGEMFIRFYTFKGGKLETTYFVDGRKATENETALIKAYKAQRADSKTQSESGLNDNQVKPCALKCDNLIALDCGEYHYRRNDKGCEELKIAAAEFEATAK